MERLLLNFESFGGTACRHFLGYFLVALAVFAGGPAAAADTKLGPSGLPLPRFVSIAASEANLRTGPGNRYPIEWVYNRVGLPVEIIAEYDMWRKVRDHDGGEGWMFRGLLSGRRNILIMQDQTALHVEPTIEAGRLLIAEKGVQGKLLSCKEGWCRVDIDEEKGWMPISALWGVTEGEEIR